MARRDEIREALKSMLENPASLDSKHNELKTTQILSGEVLLEVVDTLDKIDENNKMLGDSNITIQKWMVRLTVLILAVALLTLLVAFKGRQPDKIYINGRETIQPTH